MCLYLCLCLCVECAQQLHLFCISPTIINLDCARLLLAFQMTDFILLLAVFHFVCTIILTRLRVTYSLILSICLCFYLFTSFQCIRAVISACLAIAHHFSQWVISIWVRKDVEKDISLSPPPKGKCFIWTTKWSLTTTTPTAIHSVGFMFDKIDDVREWTKLRWSEWKGRMYSCSHTFHCSYINSIYIYKYEIAFQFENGRVVKWQQQWQWQQQWRKKAFLMPISKENS